MPSPKERVREACARYGEAAIALWCADLLAGRAGFDEPAYPSIVWLGGPSAEAIVAKRLKPEYWPRVWGARGLLYAWTPAAAPAVVAALGDQSWRVREMSLKVVRLRELGEAAEIAADLTGDEVERVRKAAVRALARIGEAEHAEAIGDLLDDRFVQRDAEFALDEMRRRLDRPL
jgi:HEAT repeat protein